MVKIDEFGMVTDDGIFKVGGIAAYARQRAETAHERQPTGNLARVAALLAKAGIPSRVAVETSGMGYPSDVLAVDPDPAWFIPGTIVAHSTHRAPIVFREETPIAKARDLAQMAQDGTIAAIVAERLIGHLAHRYRPSEARDEWRRKYDPIFSFRHDPRQRAIVVTQNDVRMGTDVHDERGQWLPTKYDRQERATLYTVAEVATFYDRYWTMAACHAEDTAAAR
jgi:hypothetical protein